MQENNTHSLHKDDRIYTEKSDPEIISLYTKWKSGKLILQPEFQRAYVWDKYKASRLVESVLLGLPLPIIYLAEEGERGGERIEVIDGQQRLTSFFSFLDETFPSGEPFTLSDLEIFSELNGMFFSQMPEQLQDQLKYYSIRTITVKQESNPNLKFIIYERINSGSMPLNTMEIRKCIYRGPYLDLLTELAAAEALRKSLNISDYHPNMRDIELVLRYAAFFHTNATYDTQLIPFMNRDMKQHQYISPADATELSEAFSKSLTFLTHAFADVAFRRYKIGTKHDPNGGWNKALINTQIFDSCMLAVTPYDPSELYENVDAIREGLLDLIASDEYYSELVTIDTTSQDRVIERFRLARERVESIVKAAQVAEKEQIYTSDIKQALFDRNNLCTICGGEIKQLDDSVINKVEAYWMPGTTIRKNARLSHRYCADAVSKADEIKAQYEALETEI